MEIKVTFGIPIKEIDISMTKRILKVGILD